jgi:hypothetical protein
VEFFNYNGDEEEYDKILKEADPCEDCGSKDSLALVAVTSIEQFGSLLLLCMDCNLERDEEDILVEKKLDRTYA